VLLLGVTYKKDVADQRESPARMIGRKLRSRVPISPTTTLTSPSGHWAVSQCAGRTTWTPRLPVLTW